MRYINMVNGYLQRENTSVGPSYDPYGRTIVTRTTGKDRLWRLVSCGLAGEWLEDGNGNKIAELGVVYFDKVEQKRLAEEYETKVIQVTGQSPRFWMEKVWELRERARWRSMTPQQRFEYEMMQEVDAALLSYAM